jgi:hypothetical protein
MTQTLYHVCIKQNNKKPLNTICRKKKKRMGAGKGPYSWTQFRAPARAARKRNAVKLMLPWAGVGLLQNP